MSGRGPARIVPGLYAAVDVAASLVPPRSTRARPRCHLPPSHYISERHSALMRSVISLITECIASRNAILFFFNPFYIFNN